MFDFDAWPCGRYATDTIQGTKAGHTAAAAWTTMRLLGRNGYLDIARCMRRTTDILVEGAARLGLKTLATPEAGVLVLTSDDQDIFAISDSLTQHGSPHCTVLDPEALHVLMNPVEHDASVRALLDAMEIAVRDVANAGVACASTRVAFA